MCFKMDGVVGVILCVFGLFRLCVGGAVHETIMEVKFCRARYAFKFRVRSMDVHKECSMFIPSQSATTTLTPSKPTTIIPSSEMPSTGTEKNDLVGILEANALYHTEGSKGFLAQALSKTTKEEATRTVTDTESVWPTSTPYTQELATDMDTDAMPITLRSAVNTKQTQTNTERNVSTTMTATTLKLSNNKQPDVFDKVTTPTQSPTLPGDSFSSEQTTDTLDTSTTTGTNTTQFTTTQPNTNVTDVMAKTSTSNKATEVSEESLSTQIITKIDDNTTDNPSKSDVIVNTTPASTTTDADNGVAKKMECGMFADYQIIEIVKKHIFKGKKELQKMNRVKDMKTRYSSTIRLDLNFNLKLPPGHYLYTGNAIPNDKDENYVFMANHYNVMPWRKARKYKKSLFTNHQNTC